MDSSLSTLFDENGCTTWNGYYIPITKGFLVKDNPKSIRTIKRYFILNQRGLTYYKDIGGEELGNIDLSDCLIEAFHIKKSFLIGYNNFIRISTSTRVWNLSADSLEELVHSLKNYHFSYFLTIYFVQFFVL